MGNIYCYEIRIVVVQLKETKWANQDENKTKTTTYQHISFLVY